LRFDENRIVKEVGFSGEMCAIAKASASLLLMSIEGMTKAAVAAIHDTQVLQNLDAPIRSNRIKCALLPAAALRGALRSSLYVVRKPLALRRIARQAKREGNAILHVWFQIL